MRGRTQPLMVMISEHILSPKALSKGTRGLALLAFLAVAQSTSAQLVVTPSASPAALASAISGPGVTISNPTINCHAQGYGEFAYSGSQLGLEEGVILTTGGRDLAMGPNNSGSAAFNATRPGA